MEDAGRSWLKPIFNYPVMIMRIANFSPVALPRVILDPKNAQQQHKQCQNPKFYSKKCPKGHFLRAVPGKVANIQRDRCRVIFLTGPP